MEPRDIFIEYLIDDPYDIQAYLDDAMDFIHGEAQIREHVFDGYFQEKWEESAATISEFNENYFEDRDRKNLYVYLSALWDPVIMGYLQDAYEVAHIQPLSEDDIQKKVTDLKEKGVRF